MPFLELPHKNQKAFVSCGLLGSWVVPREEQMYGRWVGGGRLAGTAPGEVVGEGEREGGRNAERAEEAKGGSSQFGAWYSRKKIPSASSSRSAGRCSSSSSSTRSFYMFYAGPLM